MRSPVLSIAILPFLLASAPVSQAAEQVVLESNTASYAPGATLDAASLIVLAEGQFVVLATEAGSLVRVEGPHNGPAAGPPPADNAVRDALGQLLGRNAPELAGLAGVRGGAAGSSAPDTRPDPWLIHAERTGDQCLLREGALAFWREAGGTDPMSEVTPLAGAAPLRLEWGGSQRAAWPGERLPADGEIYLVRPSGALLSTAIRFHVLAPELASRGLATVVWLAAKGCVDQARFVLQRSRDASG
jgi:hypothetical protein